MSTFDGYIFPVYGQFILAFLFLSVNNYVHSCVFLIFCLGNSLMTICGVILDSVVVFDTHVNQQKDFLKGCAHRDPILTLPKSLYPKRSISYRCKH